MATNVVTGKTIYSVLSVSITLIFISMLVSCGSELLGIPSDKSLNNPVDPKVSGKTGQIGSGGDGGTAEGGIPTCVDNCTAPSASNSFALREANYFNPSTSSCQLGDSVAIVSSHLNQITVIYRANYASVGMWKLYGKRFSVAGDGSMALLDSSPVDLYPECYGNTSGVTEFSVIGFRSTQAPTKTLHKHWEYDPANQNITHVKLGITCVNSAQSGTKTFNLTSGIVTSFEEPLLYTNTGWYGGSGYQVAWNGTADTSVCHFGDCLFEKSEVFGEIFIGNSYEGLSTFKDGVKQTSVGGVYRDSSDFAGGALGRNGKLLLQILRSYGTDDGLYELKMATGVLSKLVDIEREYYMGYGDFLKPVGWYGSKGIFVDDFKTGRGRILLTPDFFN